MAVVYNGNNIIINVMVENAINIEATFTSYSGIVTRYTNTVHPTYYNGFDFNHVTVTRYIRALVLANPNGRDIILFKT